MEFSDLQDEIGADDWLIEENEISRRKLIKQTPRFNIYKADWFGDVLVYQPRSKRCWRKKNIQTTQEEIVTKSTTNSIINEEELNSKLANISLSRPPISHQITLEKGTFSDNGIEQTDSAYSSISSTPQYHTKNTAKNEFEFPTLDSLLSSSSSSSTFGGSNLSLSSSSTESSSSSSRKRKSSSATNFEEETTAVILNKDSFGSFYCDSDDDENKIKNAASQERSSWFELNELRLIAHESFMLFMGASFENLEDTFGEHSSASLVIQMNHPKAISLHNLLHANKFAANSTSPIDRFFEIKQQQQQLGLEAKLNICQQVTNAMTYLHEKNIVHGKLTSVNIYIELNQGVKISLIDNSEVALAKPLKGTTSEVQFNLPSLTYLSPEVVKTIEIIEASKIDDGDCDNIMRDDDNDEDEAHVQFDTNQFTKKSDIFSFGTLIFELFNERFPFSKRDDSKVMANNNNRITTPLSFLTTRNLPTPFSFSPFESKALDSKFANWNGNIETTSASELIYKIARGSISKINLIDNDTSMESKIVEQVISACWSTNAKERPHFKQLSFI